MFSSGVKGSATTGHPRVRSSGSTPMSNGVLRPFCCFTGFTASSRFFDSATTLPVTEFTPIAITPEPRLMFVLYSASARLAGAARDEPRPRQRQPDAEHQSR